MKAFQDGEGHGLATSARPDNGKIGLTISEAMLFAEN